MRLGYCREKSPHLEKVVTIAAIPWKPEYEGQEPPF